MIYTVWTNLDILVSTPSTAGIHALDEGDVVRLVEDEGAIWAHRAVSGHHLRKIWHEIQALCNH